MSNALAVEISNGVIAVITGITLYGITRMFKWIQSVDRRLDRIEKEMAIPGQGREQEEPE